MVAETTLVAEHPPSSGGRRTQWITAILTHPVAASLLTGAVLHIFGLPFIATSGGDLAAQDAWEEFARAHPDSAYNLAWYGGMHPISYSVVSPYVMALLGVRSTMMIVGTLSSGLLALLLVRSKAVRRPLWPAVYGCFALVGNAISGRVTFGLGIVFALAAVAVVFGWPLRWQPADRRMGWLRITLTVALSALATASSPVAGLFLGVGAAALWLQRQWAPAYSLGLAPVVVVGLSALLFPFSGRQPMSFWSTLLPVAVGLSIYFLAPREWRTMRLAVLVYAVGVVAVWIVPSPIGTNVTRLSLLFGGVVLVAIASRGPARPGVSWRDRLQGRTARVLLSVIVASSLWQVGTLIKDVAYAHPNEAWSLDLGPLLHELQVRHANLARTEVVPARSHREASALTPYINLTRGWNRQADAERNPIFYESGLLNAHSYREWLDRWAVHYVVLSTSEPDLAAAAEARLVAGGLSYLHQVWSDANWRLYVVESPTPLAAPPTKVLRFIASEVVLQVSQPGNVLVRIPSSPWLSLVDSNGKALQAPAAGDGLVRPVDVNGCLSRLSVPTGIGSVADVWTVLHAPRAGTYRIAAPYSIPRGTACPDNVIN
jgi:hypothetical protein